MATAYLVPSPVPSHMGFTKMANSVLDTYQGTVSSSEWQVLTYIIRHSVGYQKPAAAISYRQFLKGHYSAEGAQLDQGCGIKGRATLNRAIGSLETKGLVKRTATTRDDGGIDTNLYEVVLPASETPSTKTILALVPQRDYPPYQNETSPSTKTGPLYKDVKKVSERKEDKERGGVVVTLPCAPTREDATPATFFEDDPFALLEPDDDQDVMILDDLPVAEDKVSSPPAAQPRRSSRPREIRTPKTPVPPKPKPQREAWIDTTIDEICAAVGWAECVKGTRDKLAEIIAASRLASCTPEERSWFAGWMPNDYVKRSSYRLTKGLLDDEIAMWINTGKPEHKPQSSRSSASTPPAFVKSLPKPGPRASVNERKAYAENCRARGVEP